MEMISIEGKRISLKRVGEYALATKEIKGDEFDLDGF